MESVDPFTQEQRVAYFSMEIALRSEIPTYSGGLGVLAGDTMRAAADLGLPMVAVTLLSRAGYFHQQIANGWQTETPDWWQPESWAQPLPAKIAVGMEGHDVWVRSWLYTLEGQLGGVIPIIFLDTGLNENSADDQKITHFLYGGDSTYRLKQEIVLGIGGARMLAALGLRIRKYHLNEGHAALLTLELLRRITDAPAEVDSTGTDDDLEAVRRQCVFTTHTPVDAGHDQFPYDLVDRVLGGIIERNRLRALAGQERLNMTRLALNLSGHVNGVAKRHAEVTRNMFPGYRVNAVTNGVHPWMWTCPSFRQLYDQHLPGWCHEPEILVRADQLSNDLVWQAHEEAKRALLDRILASTGQVFEPALPVIGFARRMTAYKRPDLLFSDCGRLEALAREHPFQVVVAGKAHPQDEPGKRLIQHLYMFARDLGHVIPIAFLPGYDLELARLMVSGSDVWLNTPLPPMEASGTSGMKAAFNGVPNLSVLDGWWLEGCIEGVTGWSIGSSSDGGSEDHASALYEKFGRVVLPLYHGDRRGWIAVMKGAIAKNAYFFNSLRMLRRYVIEAYFD